MASRCSLTIPGLRGPFQTIEVRSPYSGEVIAEVETLDAACMAHALAVARRAFADRKQWLPAHRRAEILRRVSAEIERRLEELAILIAREGGKPFTDARVEAQRAANTVRLCAEEATRVHGEEIPMEGTAAALRRMAFTVREPIGVVAAVSAFNHPLNLIAHQAGPAVAAGCPVLVKPDIRTPLSCVAFMDMLREAGWPAEWGMAVPCANEVAEQLVTSPDIDFLSFIGSARVGWRLRSMLAPGVRCALEHGGAAPVIVDETADLELAIPLLLKGGYYHAGQVCVSVQRVFAQRAVKDELVGRLAVGAAKLRVGDPALPETEVGPLILPREVERVHEWVREAVSMGAGLATGGEPLDHNCYRPTVLVDVPAESRCMAQEVFGPVICVNGFQTLDEAISVANSRRWSFQSAVFTRDVGRALFAARWLDASAVMVNDHTAFRVDWMPFGGRRESGLSMGGVGPTVRDMTQEKLIVIRAQ